MMIEDTFDNIDSTEKIDDSNNSDEPSNEPNSEQKKQIAQWVNDGLGLSDIQKKINDDFGIVMTYMDVRFLVDDLDLDLVDEEEEVVPDAEDSPETGEQPSPEDPLESKDAEEYKLSSIL